MSQYKQDSEYASGPKYAKILNMENGSVLNMLPLQSVLDIPEYGLTEF